MWSIADQSKVDKGQVQQPAPSSSGAMMTIPQATATITTTTTTPPQQLHCNIGTQPADSIRPGELLFFSLYISQECECIDLCVCVRLGKPAARLQEGFQKKAQVYFVRACACLFE